MRYKEDMPPLGLDFITLGLNDVLYDVKRHTVYTPNTNQWATPAVPEARYAPDQSRDESGRFADEGKAAGSTAKAAAPAPTAPKNTPGGGLTASDGSATIKATPKQRKAFTNALHGTQTPTGETLRRVSGHSADRMIERGITAEIIKNTLANPDSVYPGNKPDSHCAQKWPWRIVYGTNGRLITVINLKETK